MAKIMSSAAEITEAEVVFLMSLVLQAPDGNIVELGCYKGHSTEKICRACRAEQFVTTIDNFKYQRFGPSSQLDVTNRLNRLGFKASVVEGETTQIPKGINSVSMLFIDSDHRPEPLRKELLTWLPLLSTNSIIAFHDYNNPKWPDITGVIDSVSKDWQLLGQAGMLIAFSLP